MAVKRAALTREAILDAAMHLSSTSGGASLTFARLGRSLGADPTAVYRHFRDKDDLVLALTERLVAESTELAAAQRYAEDDWRGALLGLATAIRTVHLARPALAVLSANRTTAGFAERRGVERIIGLLHGAGLPAVEAAECYRLLIDVTLALVQATASWMLLDEHARAKDDRAWAVTYGMLPAEEFPLLHASTPRLVQLSGTTRRSSGSRWRRCSTVSRCASRAGGPSRGTAPKAEGERSPARPARRRSPGTAPRERSCRRIPRIVSRAQRTVSSQRWNSLRSE